LRESGEASARGRFPSLPPFARDRAHRPRASASALRTSAILGAFECVKIEGSGEATALGKFHTLRREQWIPKPLPQVFAFFSDAENLEEITPPWLRFEIVTPGPIRIAAGTRIRYRLRWHGVPLFWTTEIRRWDPPHCFVDVQLRGPFRLWHHTHRFEPYEGGTRMTDVVRYRLPLGIIGRVVHALKVRRDVESIFDYRFRRINELFGGDTVAGPNR
jgi:ligand-binding SRPBCC domain-containing protein